MPLLHSVQFGYGNPSTLVFLGSIGSTTAMWLPQLDALAQSHRVIALDHRGHGRSKVVDAPCTVEDLANDVLQTLDALGVRSFGVVGLSLGGAIAQHLAATSDRVTRAAFLCTSPNFADSPIWGPTMSTVREGGTELVANNMIEHWFTKQYAAFHPATVHHCRRMITSTNDADFLHLCQALAEWDFRDQLSKIVVPVLTIAGAADSSTPPAALDEIASSTAGPSLSQVLNPCAHMAPIEAAKDVNCLLNRHFVLATGQMPKITQQQVAAGKA